MMRKPLRRALRNMLAFALIVSMASMLGCTTKKTDEMIIRESVAEVLDNFSSPDSDMAQRFISEMDIKELGNIGLVTTDFMKAYSDDFYYDVSDIRIDNDEAEADITVYVKSFSEFEKRFSEEIDLISRRYEVEDDRPAEDPSRSSEASIAVAGQTAAQGASSASADIAPAKIKVTTSEMNSMFARTIINCMKDTPVKKAQTVTIRFTNTNNTWKPSPTAMDEILTSMIEN